jgi:hypothetical protein
MNSKTLITIAIVAGAGVLAWMYYRARTGTTGITPQPSGFDYAGAVTPFRSSEGKTIVGGAVPRSTATTTAPAPTIAPEYSRTVPIWGTL